jgi:hypothetical protein
MRIGGTYTTKERARVVRAGVNRTEVQGSEAGTTRQEEEERRPIGTLQALGWRRK